MNPSASGWIPKYLNIWEVAFSNKIIDYGEIPYETLQRTGFVHGVSTTSFLSTIPTKIKLTSDEVTKINLFHLLVTIYYKYTDAPNGYDAIHSILHFYRVIEKGKKGFFNQFTRYSKNHAKLERILAVRIHESNSLLKSNFTSLLTYAFLYVDVLAYEYYLKENKDIKEFIERLENHILQICFKALQRKEKKNKYDRLLLELVAANNIENSSEYMEKQLQSYVANAPRNLRNYILDLSCMAVWDDHTMDASEALYIRELCEKLKLTDVELAKSIQTIITLTQGNSVSVKLFEYAHPINQFYKQATKTVKTLIVRNKSRLLTELNESGELLMLLGKSTSKELSKEEKIKVRAQLLDICKTIPSLTIFLLPGGTLLLPLLIKFIPQLLPSAFDENRIKKQS